MTREEAKAEIVDALENFQMQAQGMMDWKTPETPESLADLVLDIAGQVQP